MAGSTRRWVEQRTVEQILANQILILEWLSGLRPPGLTLRSDQAVGATQALIDILKQDTPK